MSMIIKSKHDAAQILNKSICSLINSSFEFLNN